MLFKAMVKQYLNPLAFIVKNIWDISQYLPVCSIEVSQVKLIWKKKTMLTEL